MSSGFNKKTVQKRFILSEEISSIVDEMVSDGLTVYYQHGYWLEIANILKEMGTNTSFSELRYPLLYLGVIPSEGSEDNNYYSEVSFVVYIIAQTQANYTTQERIDNIFEPTIYPLVDSFLDKLKKLNPFFRNIRLTPTTRQDIFYLGGESENQNRLNDIVDATFLNFSNIKILK